MRYTYCAPSGHEIYAPPDKRDEGIGRSEIKSRNSSTIEYEITAWQGEYRVVFTSHERWTHRVASGDYSYEKPTFQYMEILQKEIEAMASLSSGTFEVIAFLKSKRI